MSAPDPSPASNTAGVERREHLRAREVFNEAITLIEPFFAPENHWGSRSLDHLAYRTLRDRYPDMSYDEVHVLVVAARRVFASR
ncbi:MAG: hypothetical protein JNK52_02250 [Zoogloeaceae bacterium]|nr:hypothetical protein [Zoogloeaceae bacterium]